MLPAKSESAVEESHEDLDLLSQVVNLIMRENEPKVPDPLKTIDD